MGEQIIHNKVQACHDTVGDETQIVIKSRDLWTAQYGRAQTNRLTSTKLSEVLRETLGEWEGNLIAQFIFLQDLPPNPFLRRTPGLIPVLCSST